MKEENRRHHYFELPGKTGALSLELKNDCFPGLSDDELYQFGKLLSDFLYGLLLENPEMRDNSLNIFQSILKDASISIEGKDIDSLLKYSNRAFRNGDYQNSLFLSQLILSRINQIIDKKIENNDRLIDKEIIHLQISTLNFIGYLFSKLGVNVDYGLKLTKIANTLLDEFDEDDDDTIALRTAILDTLGSLYILKKDWENAIISLDAAHDCDRLLISHGQINEISFRLTCSNLGYALVQNCNKILDSGDQDVTIHSLEEDLKRAKELFMMVHVDKAPVVPESQLKDLELSAAIKRMKKGLEKYEEARKKLQKRFI
jgi:hypothetical protein